VCQLCGDRIPDIGFDYESPDPDRLSVDHIVPRSQGGGDEWENLQPVHQRCNMRKGGRLLSNGEFRAVVAERDRQQDQGVRLLRSPQSSPPSFLRDSRPSEAVVRPRGDVGMLAPVSDGTGRQTAEQARRSRMFWTAAHVNVLYEDCQRGHRFTEENTYYRLDPTTGEVARECRTCRKASREAGQP
jgi:hypothetical protein